MTNESDAIWKIVIAPENGLGSELVSLGLGSQMGDAYAFIHGLIIRWATRSLTQKDLPLLPLLEEAKLIAVRKRSLSLPKAPESKSPFAGIDWPVYIFSVERLADLTPTIRLFPADDGRGLDFDYTDLPEHDLSRAGLPGYESTWLTQVSFEYFGNWRKSLCNTLDKWEGARKSSDFWTIAARDVALQASDVSLIDEAAQEFEELETDDDLTTTELAHGIDSATNDMNWALNLLGPPPSPSASGSDPWTPTAPLGGSR